MQRDGVLLLEHDDVRPGLLADDQPREREPEDAAADDRDRAPRRGQALASAAMRRRPDRALLSLLAPLLLFIAFGAARVDAPVSLIGLLFDRRGCSRSSRSSSRLGAALLFVRPVERRVAGVFAPAREPTEEEAALLGRLLGDLGRRSGIDTAKLHVLVHESGELNAAAGAARLLFVTDRALRLPEPQLEALLAHELGHHRGLHPLATTLVWWLALPGEALAKVYSLLRGLARRLTGSVRLLALPSSS